jgi:short-subunit dehydrogenase
MIFKDKSIWITGASSGIGKALAIEWAKYKTKLILSDRDIDKLSEVKINCEEKGAECLAIPFDLTDPEAIIQAAKKVKESFSTIDILVNNGGISQRSLAIETPVSVDRKIMETNFFGAITLTKEVLPLMKQNQSGHIVVISSVVGKFGFPLRTAYSASKHALQGYFESLRAELNSDNINITIVSPGRINTNISFNAINHEGKIHGIMDPGQAKGISAEKCAKKIILAVKKNKKDILVARGESLMVYIRKFLPSIYYKMATRVSPT